MCFLQPVDRLILTGILKQKTHRQHKCYFKIQFYIGSELSWNVGWSGTILDEPYTNAVHTDPDKRGVKVLLADTFQPVNWVGVSKIIFQKVRALEA